MDAYTLWDSLHPLQMPDKGSKWLFNVKLEDKNQLVRKKFAVFIPWHYMFKVYKNQTLSFQYFITSKPKTFTTFSFRQNKP